MLMPKFSRHGRARARQRGMRESDIALLIECGTPVGEECVFLRQRDVQREIAKRKREIQRLEHLSGRKVVLARDLVITAYKATREHEKRLLRD